MEFTKGAKIAGVIGLTFVIALGAFFTLFEGGEEQPPSIDIVGGKQASIAANLVTYSAQDVTAYGSCASADEMAFAQSLNIIYFTKDTKVDDFLAKLIIPTKTLKVDMAIYSPGGESGFSKGFNAFNGAIPTTAIIKTSDTIPANRAILFYATEKGKFCNKDKLIANSNTFLTADTTITPSLESIESGWVLVAMNPDVSKFISANKLEGRVKSIWTFAKGFGPVTKLTDYSTPIANDRSAIVWIKLQEKEAASQKQYKLTGLKATGTENKYLLVSWDLPVDYDKIEGFDVVDGGLLVPQININEIPSQLPSAIPSANKNSTLIYGLKTAIHEICIIAKYNTGEKTPKTCIEVDYKGVKSATVEQANITIEKIALGGDHTVKPGDYTNLLKFRISSDKDVNFTGLKVKIAPLPIPTDTYLAKQETSGNNLLLSPKGSTVNSEIQIYQFNQAIKAGETQIFTIDTVIPDAENDMTNYRASIETSDMFTFDGDVKINQSVFPLFDVKVVSSGVENAKKYEITGLKVTGESPTIALSWNKLQDPDKILSFDFTDNGFALKKIAANEAPPTEGSYAVINPTKLGTIINNLQSGAHKFCVTANYPDGITATACTEQLNYSADQQKVSVYVPEGAAKSVNTANIVPGSQESTILHFAINSDSDVNVKSIKFDGNFQYSPVIQLRYASSNEVISTLPISDPNSTTQTFNIPKGKLKIAKGSPVELEVVGAGFNINSLNAQQPIWPNWQLALTADGVTFYEVEAKPDLFGGEIRAVHNFVEANLSITDIPMIAKNTISEVDASAEAVSFTMKSDQNIELSNFVMKVSDFKNGGSYSDFDKYEVNINNKVVKTGTLQGELSNIAFSGISLLKNQSNKVSIIVYQSAAAIPARESKFQLTTITANGTTNSLKVNSTPIEGFVVVANKLK